MEIIDIMNTTTSYGMIALKYIGIPLLILITLKATGVVRYIANDQVGIVEKIWSFRGSLKDGFISTDGRAGFQPEIIRGGFHFFFPLQYNIHKQTLVTIPQGQIGYVFARDGQPLEASQTLASNETAANFEDTKEFLEKGGQKGPQRKVLREGVYAINLAQFAVFTKEKTYAIELNKEDNEILNQMYELINKRDGFSPIIIKDTEDKIGIITTHDGPSLPTGEIIAPIVGDKNSEENFHDNFQMPEKFIKAGGYRGRQLQVLVDGTYYINRLFATVEKIEKTTIEIGTVGVVVSYTGNQGTDISGEDYRHGELVEKGEKGVWKTPLMPGKYPFNTYAGKIHSVPTTNFILKWTKSSSGQHKFDDNLAEVGIITKDAFESMLPLSVVVHIDYKKAPQVIQRFGDIKKLVDQTLDPMVSAYFKNTAQKKTLVELLQNRADIQTQAGVDMKDKFQAYSLDLEEVLIGTPKAPEDGVNAMDIILTQLRNRQVAMEQVETYRLQGEAAIQEKTLREKEAEAAQQTHITESLLSIEIQENKGKASRALATQEAEIVKIRADADAQKQKLEGMGKAENIKAIAEAEALRITKTGLAQAEATEKQVKAFGGSDYQLVNNVMIEFMKSIEKGNIPIVPQFSMSGNGGNESGMATVIGTMVAMNEMMKDKTKKEAEQTTV